MINRIQQFFARLLRKDKKTSKCLIVPSYDEATYAMSRWIKSWDMNDVSFYIGDEAQHSRALSTLHGSGHLTKLLMFIGHGKATGLLTKPGIGKANSPIGSMAHSCLLDTEDLTPNLKYVHILAWACDAGSYFGPKVASLNASSFLGFKGPLSLIINHQPSEDAWSSVMEEFFRRISSRGFIESHDAEWLKHELLSLRRKIKNGVIDTGTHKQINTMFLKAAAKGAIVQISGGQ